MFFRVLLTLHAPAAVYKTTGDWTDAKVEDAGKLLLDEGRLCQCLVIGMF